MGGILSGYVGPTTRYCVGGDLMVSEDARDPMLKPLVCYCCGNPSTYLESETQDPLYSSPTRTHFFCRGCLEVSSDKLDYILDKLKEREGWRFLSRCSNKAKDDEHITYFYQKSRNIMEI